MTLDSRFTIAKVKGTSLWNEYSEGCFLLLSDLILFLKNDSLYEHGVIFRLLYKL